MRTSSVELVIFQILSKKHTHLTALEVYETARLQLPAVNPSTVYRALERMVQRGEVSVSDMGTGSAVYERVTSGQHHHLVCQGCGEIITIENDEVGLFFKTLQDQYQFSVCTNHLILFGFCQKCQSTRQTYLEGEKAAKSHQENGKSTQRP